MTGASSGPAPAELGEGVGATPALALGRHEPGFQQLFDIDLRTWSFAFGAGIRIEAPAELRQEHQERLQAALAVVQPA